MHNVNSETLFTCVHSNKGKKIKNIKTVVKIHEQSLVYLCGDKTANQVNFMLSMLISCSCYFNSLEGDIRKVSNLLTSEN